VAQVALLLVSLSSCMLIARPCSNLQTDAVKTPHVYVHLSHSLILWPDNQAVVSSWCMEWCQLSDGRYGGTYACVCVWVS
jgi:hypothetical protein